MDGMRPGPASLLLALLSAITAPGIRAQQKDRDPDKAKSPALPSAFGALHPRVSHDGKWIACIYQGRLARIPAEGGVLKILVAGISPATHPAWSPDDKTILVASGGAVRRLDAESGADLPFAKPVTGRGPFWFSKDGKRVLGRFLTKPPDAPIAWLDLATGEVAPVAGVPENHASKLRGIYAPTPDGEALVFVEHLDREGEQGGNRGSEADLWRIPFDGGEATKIVRWPSRIYGLCPDPNGEAVYAVTDGGDAHNGIWRIPFADSLAGATKLTWGEADEDSPSLGDDGRALVYTDNRLGSTALVRQSLDSGETDLVRATAIDSGTPSVRLGIAVRDGAGAPLTARVSVKDSAGDFHAPPGSLYRRFNNVLWFYVSGETSLELPPGGYSIRCARGVEYEIEETTIEITEAEASVTLSPRRWTDEAARGWYSGENHIHANYGYGEWYQTPASIVELCEGEDLGVANLVVANSDGNGVFDREFFLGRLEPRSKPRTLVWWNQEFRSTIWGHMTLFHLKQVVEPVYTGFPGTTNPWDIPTNAEIARRTRLQGGVASYTHPTNNPLDFYDQPYSAKGLPVDAALGLIDVVDVMGYVYEPTVPFWHRLLNCGFRLPAAAGTDVFLNRINSAPAGHGRAYVRIEGEFSYEAWVEGLKAGRTFVTNGPMLDLSVEGRGPGAVIRLKGPGRVRVKGGFRSDDPVASFVVVKNGETAAEAALAEMALSGSIETEIEVERSGWIALRAAGPPNERSMMRPMGAHTSPVYVEIAGRPAASAKDAAFFVEWIDRLEADLKKRDRIPADEVSEVMAHLERAREVYRKIIREADPDSF